MSQEFDSVLDLVKEKKFYLYEYMSDFEKFKEELPSNKSFDSSFTDRKINDKEYHTFLKVWNKFEIKTMKDNHNLYFKWDFLLLADVLNLVKAKLKLGCNA